MKKLLCAIFMSSVLLVGCGSNTQDDIKQTTESFENQSVQQIYDTVSALDSETLDVIDDTLISNYYGIDTADMNDYVFAQSSSATSAGMIIIAKGSDLSKYEENINNIISQKTDEMTNYNEPEQVELLNDAKIKFTDNYFYVVVANDSDKIADAIDSSLK